MLCSSSGGSSSHSASVRRGHPMMASTFSGQLQGEHGHAMDAAGASSTHAEHMQKLRRSTALSTERAGLAGGVVASPASSAASTEGSSSQSSGTDSSGSGSMQPQPPLTVDTTAHSSNKSARRHSATSNGMSTPTHDCTREEGSTRPARRKVIRLQQHGDSEGEGAQRESPSQSRAYSATAGYDSAEQHQHQQQQYDGHGYGSGANAAAEGQDTIEGHSVTDALPQLQTQMQLPHMDIATYPTPALLHALAELLTRITEANDRVRVEREERERERERAPSSAAAAAFGARGEAGAGAGAGAGASDEPASGHSASISGRHARSQSVLSDSSSRTGNNEPVTPAVPLSSPASSRDGSGSTEAGRERKRAFLSSLGMTSYPFPDFEERMKRLAREQGTGTSTSEASASAGASAGAGAGVDKGTNEGAGADPSAEGTEDGRQADTGEAGADTSMTGADAAGPDRGANMDTRSASPNGNSGHAAPHGAGLQDPFSSSAPPDRDLQMASPASPTRLPRANFCTSRHSHLSPAAAGAPAPAPAARTVLTSSLAALSTPNATLCFHARNVPSISIESYLVRIAKYCPTTNEVFVSLLVYFDRMSHLPALAAPAGQEGRALGEERVEFAVDSFNIHRLIIAGITVASKFFSDVFYTNSRYAKVGGLPLPELNALEIQFLLLNGFDLTVSPSEIQVYADRLLVGSLPAVAEVVLPCCVAARQPPPAPPTTEGRASAGARPALQRSATAAYHQAVLSASHAQLTRPPAPEGTGKGRPNSSHRSTSESSTSTSASEASTVVPSESSVDTERVGGHSEDEHEQADQEMEPPAQQEEAAEKKEGSGAGSSGARTPGAKTAPLPFLGMQALSMPGAGAGAGAGPSDGAQSKPRSKAVPLHQETQKGESDAGPAGTHKRHDSRTREWTAQQRAQLQQSLGWHQHRDGEDGGAGDGDVDMAEH